MRDYFLSAFKYVKDQAVLAIKMIEVKEPKDKEK